MKKPSIRSIAVVLIAMALVVGFLPSDSFAETRLQRVKRELKDYKNLKNKISSDASKLSSSQKAVLKTTLPPATLNGLDDSDSDGVPDIIEDEVDGTNHCDGSSHEDGMEVEVVGAIDSLPSGSSFAIGARVFDFDGNTEYNGSPGDASGLIVSACVKVEGRTQDGSSSYYAKEVKYLDPSRCTGGGEDD